MPGMIGSVVVVGVVARVGSLFPWLYSSSLINKMTSSLLRVF